MYNRYYTGSMSSLAHISTSANSCNLDEIDVDNYYNFNKVNQSTRKYKIVIPDAKTIETMTTPYLEPVGIMVTKKNIPVVVIAKRRFTSTCPDLHCVKWECSRSHAVYTYCQIGYPEYKNFRYVVKGLEAQAEYLGIRKINNFTSFGEAVIGGSNLIDNLTRE